MFGKRSRGRATSSDGFSERGSLATNRLTSSFRLRERKAKVVPASTLNSDENLTLVIPSKLISNKSMDFALSQTQPLPFHKKNIIISYQTLCTVAPLFASMDLWGTLPSYDDTRVGLLSSYPMPG